jgi:peptide/nickel transport system ATP-binding protein
MVPPVASSDAPAPKPALDVAKLSISYGVGDRPVKVVRDVSFRIATGEAYGLIGESGSGKTSVAFSVLNYLPGGHAEAEHLSAGGRNVLEMSLGELRELRGGQVGMVYQDPMNALNPVIRCGDQIVEVLQRHARMGAKEARARAVELFDTVRLPDPAEMAARYPHQLSGGQLQRVVIAMAIACKPSLLILDEPTTALDVTTQARILDLIAELRRHSSTSVLFISHNLAVVGKVCDRVGVLYAGELVEEGDVRDVLTSPRHHYTLGLIRAVPSIKDDRPLTPIPGSLPRIRDGSVEGCIFVARCPAAQELCSRKTPAWHETKPGHGVKCHFPVRDEALQGDGARPRAPRARDEAPLLEVDDLRLSYGRARFAVEDVSFAILPGETLGVVGESGSGKSTIARSIAGLMAPDRGRLVFGGKALGAVTAGRDGDTRRRIQMVFQNPMASLNPKKTVAESVARPLLLYGLCPRSEVEGRVADMLQSVRLGPEYLHRYPRELSGGERQRVSIARAFITDPDLVVCDEPTSALDVSVQAAVLEQLRELQRKRGTALLFISHDLAVIRYMSDNVLVMSNGRVVEKGSIEAVFDRPESEYTRNLLASVPDLATDGLAAGSVAA